MNQGHELFLNNLTEKERDVYNSALEDFTKGPTYQMYTEKKAIEMRDSLQKDYAMIQVENFRRHRHNDYK